MKLSRGAGVLLHPTSLSGPGGIGTLGDEARRFVDWLGDAEQSCWQILPLVAIDEGGSPYNALSTMAGNPLLIDLQALQAEGLLSGPQLPPDGAGQTGSDRVDYPAVAAASAAALRAAHAAFRSGAAPHLHQPFEEYRRAQAGWLPDYSLFRALRDRYDRAAWTRWDPPLRDREPRAIAAARAELGAVIEAHELAQFLFDRQWAAIRNRANDLGVRVVGDIPIFVAHDSADVWAEPDLFELDPAGEPRVVSGVPPDYFSETGQRWGNPLYDWDRMRDREYDWWIRRFRRTLEWVDLVRVDHFRGFEAYWEIPVEERTAVNGRWRKGPGRELFDAVGDALGELPIIAEDLGLITAEVEELRDELSLPGMRVLQFAFDGDPRNPHLPENYPENVVGYTGTHDNDTSVGWWESLDRKTRERAGAALPPAEEPLHWQLLEMVFRSRAALAVAPVQDLLGLDSSARMNVPGTSSSNWSWRLRPGLLTAEVRGHLRRLTRSTGRSVVDPASVTDLEGEAHR